MHLANFENATSYYCLLKSSQRTGIGWQEWRRRGSSSPGRDLQFGIVFLRPGRDMICIRFDLEAAAAAPAGKVLWKYLHQKKCELCPERSRGRISQNICYLQLVFHSRSRLWLKVFFVSTWLGMCETVVMCPMCQGSLIMNIKRDYADWIRCWSLRKGKNFNIGKQENIFFRVRLAM